MLPDHPRLRGRLVRCARLLLDWSQARLAHEAGITTGVVYTIESGRLNGDNAAIAMAIRALQRGGVEFTPATAHRGPGVRFIAIEPDRPA